MAKGSKSGAIALRVFQKFEEEVDKEYKEERKKIAETLHEEMVSIITNLKSDVQTTLYVLEIIKFQTLTGEYQRLFSPPAEGIKPTTIKVKEEKGE